MKKLILFFALLALSAAGANAQTVELDSNTIPFESVTTVPGEDYIVTPVSGAWKEFRLAAPTGCDAGGANCTFGFEFSYALNNSISTVVTTGEFATAALAFDSAQVIGFTAVNNSTSFSIPCFPCAFAVGVITFDVALGSLLSSPPAVPDIPVVPDLPAAPESAVPDFTIIAIADDLAQLSVEFSPCGDGGCELAGPDGPGFDQFDPLISAACDGGACDAFFETADFLFETAFDCTGASCIDYERLAQDDRETIVFSRLDDSLDNESLSAEEVIIKFADFQAANAAFSETAQALAAVMGDDRNPYQILLDGINPVLGGYYEKQEEFNATEIGAALNAAMFDRENSSLEEIEIAVDRYNAASQAYAPDEYQAYTEAYEYLSLIYRRVYGARDRASANQDEEPAVSADSAQNLTDSNVDSLTGFLEALGDADRSEMNDELDSVVHELAPLTVIAGSGPLKTYAAADGAVIIVTAFADTGR